MSKLTFPISPSALPPLPSSPFPTIAFSTLDSPPDDPSASALTLLATINKWLTIRKNLPLAPTDPHIADLDALIADDVYDLVSYPIAGDHTVQLDILERMTALQNSLAGVKVDTNKLAGSIELRTRALVRGREVGRVGKVSLGYLLALYTFETFSSFFLCILCISRKKGNIRD